MTLKTLKRLTLAMAGALLIGGAASTPTLAADRALLIGVGNYQNPIANLPGINLDIGIMKEVAESLGFAASNIKVLMDKEATLSNVRSTMDSWLVNGVNPDDRVLIYYSGHGAPIPDENGDEEDGADEVLTMHDLSVTRRNGKAALSGVLVDDEFNTILSKIRSKNVLVLIDACHSGTATKSIHLSTRSLGVADGIDKLFEYEGMPLSSRSFKVEGKNFASGDGYVAISAAADNEKSIATKRGSVFTLGVKDAVLKAKKEGDDNLTPRKIWHTAKEFVSRSLPPERRFNPQINGSNALMDRALNLVATSQGRGPAWRKVEQLADGSGTVKLLADKQSFYEGDNLVLRIQVPEDGYLNIVSVGPDDVPTVLFPNQYHQDNRVTAGTVTLPTEKMNFDLATRAPYGANLTVAVVTKQPINLFQNADGNRDTKGILEEGFGQLSEDGLYDMRGYKVEARNSKKYQAGKLETRTCLNASSCN